MKIQEKKIEEIAHKIDMVEVVSEYVILTQKGNRFWGLCPFHTEKTPSFTITPEKGVFYCFGCQKGGSIFNFIMEVEKLNFIESVKYLAKKAGVDINYQGDNREAIDREAYWELNKHLINTFQHLLFKSKSGEKALQYLLDRGLNQKTIEAFQLGYAPVDKNWLFNFLIGKKYEEGFLIKIGLFNKEKIPFFHNRIMFPIINRRNEVIGFSGRNLGEFGPKYKNSAESFFFHKRENLYGINLALSSIKEKKCFYLVEGNIDVLALHQAGITNSVAPLGTAFTNEQARLLKRYVSKAVVAFDNDNAGIKATNRVINILEDAGIYTEIVELPPNSDPADLIKNHDMKNILAILNNKTDSFQYIIKRAISLYDINEPGGRESIFDYIFKYISRTKSIIKQDVYIEKLAELLNTDKETIKQEIRLKNSRKNTRKVMPKKEGSKNINDELYLMLAVIANREYFPSVRNIISPDDLVDDWARNLYIALEDCYRSEEDSIDILLEKITDQQQKQLILKKISSEEFSMNQEQLINDTVIRIKKRSLEKKRKKIEELLQSYNRINKPDDFKIKELLTEKMYLDEELQKMKVI